MLFNSRSKPRHFSAIRAIQESIPRSHAKSVALRQACADLQLGRAIGEISISIRNCGQPNGARWGEALEMEPDAANE